MKPEIIKETARKFAEVYYPEHSDKFDMVWDMLSKTKISDSDLKKGRSGAGLSFGGETIDPQFKEMMIKTKIYELAYQKFKDWIDITETDLISKVKELCLLLEINSNFEEKVEEIVPFVFKEETERIGKTAKHQDKETEYRVWFNNTEPQGKSINIEERDQYISDKHQYDLLILQEETFTHFYNHDNEIEPPPGDLPYRILTYILKNKGTGGTAWNIAKQIHEVNEGRAIRDLKTLAKAIKEQPRIEQGKAQHKAGNYQKNVAEFSKLTSRRIVDLNDKFLNELKTNLNAKNKLKEYRLDPPIKYCFIEKVLA